MPRAIVIPKVSVDLGDVGDFTDALAAKAEVIHSHAATDVSDSTVIGRTILTAADAAAVKTALSLPSFGGAASLSVGTTTGTVAAGDDSRITGAAQKSSNLGDLASASTARTNLGLGGAATLSVGTSAGTVAAGDDSRITGALQAANDLSDLADAETARGNLETSPDDLWTVWWDDATASWTFPTLPSGYTGYRCISKLYVGATDPLASVPNGSEWIPHPQSAIYETV